MRYVEARVDEFSRDKAYRIYVTKSLKLIPQSKYISKDLEDLFTPQKVDTRTAEQITVDVMKKAGLNFG